MGVPGLWDFLNRVGTSTSIAKLATDAFEKNNSRRRAYRVGIDVSIWFHHTKSSREGENPELRNLFFRLIHLAILPIIPLFVFDGRARPKVKRGSKLGKSGSHALSQQFKLFLDAFGMEWREAPGEAEAELAYLNQEGHIDVIMTDDCDAFIFGARIICKNISSNLSGNKRNLAKNSTGKTDNTHTMVYNFEDIRNHPKVALTRGGLILFALLAGGDYDKGVEKVGKNIAYGLARCGFGDDLLEAYQNLPIPEFNEFLVHWRARVNTELNQNTRRFLPHRCSLSLPDSFPLLEVLDIYAKPLNSGKQGSSSSIALRDRKNLDLGQIAHLCEKHFEWGYKERIIERFRTLLWPCAVMHVLRRAALEADENEQRRPGNSTEVGTPSSVVKNYLGKENRLDRLADAFVNRGSNSRAHVAEPIDAHHLITKISGTREHTSTDGVLEYRIEVSPVQLVNIATAGIRGTRQPLPPKEGARVSKKIPDPPDSPFKLWMPACIINRVHPAMVEEFIVSKASKAKGKGKRKGKTSSIASVSDDDAMALPSFSSSPAKSSTSTPGGGSSKAKGKQRASSFVGMSDDKPVEFPSFSSPQATQPTFEPARNEPQRRLNPAPEMGSRTRAILDPWFTSIHLPRSAPLRQFICKGFFFTFQNPDPKEYYMQEDLVTEDKLPPTVGEERALPNHASAGRVPADLVAGARAANRREQAFMHVGEDDGYESDRALTRFDRMMDQIILAPSKAKKATKRKATGKSAGNSQPAKRRKRSILEVDMY